jgi:hypothetical protein
MLRVKQNVKLGVYGVPGETRTLDPLLRRQLLYPPELQGRFVIASQF